MGTVFMRKPVTDLRDGDTRANSLFFGDRQAFYPRFQRRLRKIPAENPSDHLGYKWSQATRDAELNGMGKKASWSSYRVCRATPLPKATMKRPIAIRWFGVVRNGRVELF